MSLFFFCFFLKLMIASDSLISDSSWSQTR